MSRRQTMRPSQIGTVRSDDSKPKRPRQATLELELYRGLMWNKGAFKYPKNYDKRATSFISEGSSSTEESMMRDEVSEAGFWLKLKRKFTIKRLQGRGFQIYSALTCSLAAFAVGSHMGWASSISEKNTPKSHTGRFDLTDMETTQVMAALPVGIILAAPPTCVLLDFVGRHGVLLMSTAPIMSGWIQVIVATSPYTMFMARLVAGFGCGMVLTAMPVYLSEIAEKDARGTVTMLFPVMISFGMLMAYVLVGFVDYPADIAILMVVPVLFFSLFIFAAESPVYLCLGEYWSTAYVLLKKLRVDEDLQFEIEYEDKMVSTDISRQTMYGFKNLCLNNHIKRLFFLTTILFSVQQLSGIFTIFAFQEKTFRSAKTPLSPTITSLCLAGAQFVGNLFTLICVDILGRRALLLISLFAAAALMGFLGLIYSFAESPFGFPETVLSWGAFSLLVAYVTIYSIGIGPIPWVLLGELTLPGVRGATAGSAVIIGGLSGIISSKFFEDVEQTWGYSTGFWTYAIVCTVGALFVGFLIPETKRSYIVDIHRAMYNIEDASIDDMSEEG